MNSVKKKPIDPTKTLKISTFSKDAERKNQYIKVSSLQIHKQRKKKKLGLFFTHISFPQNKVLRDKPNQGSERLLSAMKTSIHCKKTKTTH